MSGAVIIRPEDLHVCRSAACSALASPPATTCGVRPDASCYRCHGPTRPATAEERAEYREFLETRENPVRARYGAPPLVLAPEADT